MARKSGNRPAMFVVPESHRSSWNFGNPGLECAKEGRKNRPTSKTRLSKRPIKVRPDLI